MKRSHLLFLLLLLLSTPARAFVLQTAEVQGKEQHPRWSSGSLPLTFVMNDRPLNLLPNLSASSTPLAAVEAAMQSWALDSVAMTLNGSVATASLAKDDVNLITLADTSQNRDAVGNAWGVTLSWFRQQGAGLQMLESDVVLNPRSRMATDGAATAGDIQAILTHELGHAQGLDHSPIFSATMFPSGGAGQTSPRTLEPDDRAALRQLYFGPTDAQTGAISGQVLTTANGPVFGGHVGAIDKEGIIQVGAVTSRDGRFTLASLAPGEYQLFVEPLDGPVVPEQIGGPYYTDRQHPVMTAFQTMFAGGNRAPAWVKVEAGKITATEAIKVTPERGGLNPDGFIWTTDFEKIQSWVAPIALSEALYILIAGKGLERVPTRGFTFSSTNIAIDPNGFDRDTLEDGTPIVVMAVWRGAGARPGAYSLHMATDTERTLLPGIVEVQGP
jgi:hypothetical protein